MSHRLHERRRRVFRIGGVALLATTAVACIFERSEYQGGGRIDQGASVNSSSSSSASSTGNAPRPSSSSSSSGSPVPDAGDAG